MARAKKTTENEIDQTEDVSQTEDVTAEAVMSEVKANQDENLSEDSMVNADDIVEDLGNDAMFEPVGTELMLQVTNHGGRYWSSIIKQWVEEGQSFLTFEEEREKQRLILAFEQLNMLAGYDRFEWVG